MTVYHSLPEARAAFGPSALTIGNFDGVHLGHLAIMRRLVVLGRERGWKPSVLTFDPHPTRVVAPARAPRLLTGVSQRCALLAAAGVEQVLVLPFTADVARLSPEEFARDILHDALGARAVLVGDNFRFGNRASGDIKRLAELGREYNFVEEIVPAVALRGRVVSSSEIRRLLAEGRADRACRLLGRPYALEGEIVSGHGVGSRQTVPTLNLKTEAEVLPLRGVYITRTTDLDDGREWPSITNLGYRPTFGGDDELSIETFLLASLTGLGPKRIRLEFLRRVREERKFESPELLKAQIFHDVARAQAYFRRVGKLRRS